MSNFLPESDDLRKALIFCFHLKKSAAESHRMLVEAYGDHALSEATCKRWFQRFRDNDFDVLNKERGRPSKKFEDAELQAILNEDDTLSQKQMAAMLNVAQQTISDRLKAMGKIQKCGKWVPHELNERQMENRKNTCEILLQRHERKSVLHRIVTGDEKWIYFKNPKRKKSWINPGQPSTSTAKTDRFGKKALLCVWWDQKGVVYHELLKPGETVNTNRYRQQMINLNHALIEKRPEWARRHGKVILLHDNAPPHKAKLVQDTIKALGWELLPHPAVFTRLGPFRLPFVFIDGTRIG